MSTNMALRSTLGELIMTVITLEEVRDDLNKKIGVMQERIYALRVELRTQKAESPEVMLRDPGHLQEPPC